VINASFAGDLDYAASNGSAQLTVTSGVGNQTITFGALGNKTFGDPDFTVSATASSGLPVTFTVGVTDDCSISGVTVHITGAGSCTVTAHQSGDTDYSAAPDVPRTFSIGKANQTITFGSLSNKLLGTTPFTVSASATSGLPVSFTSTTTSTCTTSGNTVTLVALGQCSIQASQAGDVNYLPAISLTQSFQVTQVTSTALSASPNPSVFGSLVTLTATVSSPTATGAVTFYDGVAVLGTAMVSSGVATFSTRLLPAGTRSLSARYAGDAADASSLSASYPQTVNAQPATSLVQAMGSPITAGTNPFSVALGDFNGDGITDLAVANYLAPDSNVVVWLGDGLGGFTAAGSTSFTPGTQPRSVAVGDFNGDGKADLAVATFSDSKMTILLGDGTGNFTQSGSQITVGTSPSAVVIGDFNGDGKTDLATANQTGVDVSILLGDGNGGFAAPTSIPIGVGTQPNSLTVGDFNGDGKADLATANYGNGTMTVLLGDGTGAFTPSGSPYAVGSHPYSVVVEDFNGDGIADLAVSGGDIGVPGGVTVWLGNGSGGFTEAAGSPIAVGAQPTTVVIGDFNGDGKADLVTANYSDGNVTLLLGTGSGGFTQATGSPFAAGTNPYSVVVGDYNGDGRADAAVANVGGGVTILLGVDPPWQLRVTQQPSSGTVGTTIGNVILQVEDAYVRTQD
jgi:hypothetical protein